MHTHSLPSLYMCDECVCTWGGKSRSIRITVECPAPGRYSSVFPSTIQLQFNSKRERNMNNFVRDDMLHRWLYVLMLGEKCQIVWRRSWRWDRMCFPLFFFFTGWWNTKITTFKNRIPTDRVQFKAFIKEHTPTHNLLTEWFLSFVLHRVGYTVV